MNLKVIAMPLIGLVAVGLALVPSASATPTQNLGTGPTGGCYGYYDYQTKMCTGIDQKTLDAICAQMPTINPCPGSGSQSASYTTYMDAGIPHCFHVLSPLTVYNPVDGSPIVITPYDTYVGVCPGPPTGAL